MKKLKMSYENEYTGIPLRKSDFLAHSKRKKYGEEYTYTTIKKNSAKYPFPKSLMDGTILIKISRNVKMKTLDNYFDD